MNPSTAPLPDSPFGVTSPLRNVLSGSGVHKGSISDSRRNPPLSRRAWQSGAQHDRIDRSGTTGDGHYARGVMDIRAFCSQSRVVIVAGKGGVGKTTMVAALAHLAAGAGLSVLVVELEGRSGVGAAFGQEEELGYAGSVLRAAGASLVDGDGNAAEDRGGGAAAIPPGTVQARTITPDDALLE